MHGETVKFSKAILKYAVANKVLEKYVQYFMHPRAYKILLSVKFALMHPMRGSRKISPVNLNIRITRHIAVSFTNRPLYPHENGPRYLPNS